jgi:hypothetical protein
LVEAQKYHVGHEQTKIEPQGLPVDETDDEFEGMFKRLRLDTVEDQVDAYLVAPQEMTSVDPHM